MRSLASALVAVLALTGCGTATSTATPSAQAPASGGGEAQVAGERQILHALSRLTYGARPGDLERVRAIGRSI